MKFLANTHWWFFGAVTLHIFCTAFLVLPPSTIEFSVLSDIPILSDFIIDAVACLMLLSFHGYVIYRLNKLQPSLNENWLLFGAFIVGMISVCFGYGMHASTNTLDIILNLGLKANDLRLPGNYANLLVHYLHEVISHQVQTFGLFLLYCIEFELMDNAYNYVTSKKDLNSNYKSKSKSNKSTDKSKNKQKNKGTSTNKFNFSDYNNSSLSVLILLSLFSGIGNGFVVAGLESTFIAGSFSLYLVSRNIIIIAKHGWQGCSSGHRYVLLTFVVLFGFVLFYLIVLPDQQGISVLADQDRDFYWVEGYEKPWN